MVLQYDKDFKCKYNTIDKESIRDTAQNPFNTINSSTREILVPNVLKRTNLSDIERLKKLLTYSTAIAFPGSYSAAYIGGYILFKYLKELFEYHNSSFTNIKIVDILYDPRCSAIIYRDNYNGSVPFKTASEVYRVEYMALDNNDQLVTLSIRHNLCTDAEKYSYMVHVFDSFILTFEVGGELKYCILTYIKNISSSYKYEPWLFQIKKSKYDSIINDLNKCIETQGILNIKMNDYSSIMF